MADIAYLNAPVLVTGGAGFIGANFVLEWMKAGRGPLINLDKLTYAGNLASLSSISKDPKYTFIQADIGDRDAVAKILATHKPRAIINFAAESHVDRSIHGPSDFIHTNIVGTFTLLECAREYYNKLEGAAKDNFRFLHVSTDEVYGALKPNDPAFTEETQFAPNSPYAASKASADHLVRAWHHTYGLPVLTTNCSNNYGPYQFPEKLIPHMIHKALSDKPLPVYGDGKQVRDWLYVTDHCTAIATVLDKGVLGETYAVGGDSEMFNIDVVNILCKLLDELSPRADGKSYAAQIAYVTDRAGHDRRYAIDATKIKTELGWQPAKNFTTGLRKTVQWYLDNQEWVAGVIDGSYRDWLKTNYGAAHV